MCLRQSWSTYIEINYCSDGVNNEDLVGCNKSPDSTTRLSHCGHSHNPMNMPNSSKFEEIASVLAQGDAVAAIGLAADHFRASGQYDELFEIEKCRIREEFGLVAFATGDTQQLASAPQLRLEEQLLDLCREVGTLHFREENISQAWMYLQPLMDMPYVEQLFQDVEVNDDNQEELIEIALGNWAAPAMGYRLYIESRGTCNAITFYDAQIVYQSPTIQRELASILVNHVYQELRGNVLRVIADQEVKTYESRPSPTPLSELVEAHPWLFDSCGHHLDVSHLVSTLRIARRCEDAVALEQALHLADYGRQLDDQLKSPGEIPFADVFEASWHYFNARIHPPAQSSIEYFKTIEQKTSEPAAGLTLIEIYRATGHSGLAIETALNDEARLQLGLQVIEFAETDDDFELLKQHFQKQQDLAAFCISSTLQIQKRKKPS